MLGFQTGRARAAARGLQPSSAWFEIVKSQTLAAQQVAPELEHRDGLVVGLGRRTPPPATTGQGRGRLRLPLGARETLCDAPRGRAGLRHSLTEGQMSVLPCGRSV